MNKNTTYFENGIPHDTYKFKVRNMVKVLVKKEGKPHKVVAFNARTGKAIGPTESDINDLKAS